MTIKEVKECFYNFRLKNKNNYPDDYIVTKENITDIFQKFVYNENVSKIVSGFEIIDDKICFVYPVINNISINTNESFPVCGGKQELNVYANYSIGYQTQFNEIVEYKKDIKCQINALISLSNNTFNYKRPYLINLSSNNTDEIISLEIKAVYYFNGEKFEDKKTITQDINIVSDWIVESESTRSIKMNFSNHNISNNGGVCTLSVKRIFDRIYCTKNSCGEKIDEKEETNLIEDITKDCLFNSSNDAFIINENIITVQPQKPGAIERETTITANYENETISDVIYQDRGGIITSSYELQFINGYKNNTLHFKNSIPAYERIQIVSKKFVYIDGKYNNVLINDRLKVESDSKWVSCSVLKSNDSISLLIKTLETNNNKNESRNGNITIKCIDNPSLLLTLTVIQPPLKVLNENYKCEFIGSGEYTTDEIDNNEFFFEPFKMLTYENGDKEKALLGDDIKIKCSYISSNDELFNVKSISKNGSKYFVNFNNLSLYSIENISLELNLLFYKDDKKIFESNKGNIIVKGNKIRKYAYDFYFNNGTNNKKIEWIADNKPQMVKIHSIKRQISDNGKHGYELNAEFSIDEKNHTNNFILKGIGDEILVYPNNSEKETKETYYIRQKGSDKKLVLNLYYKPKKQVKKLPLSVIVYSYNSKENIWTNKDGYLLIDKKRRINLSPCWISPQMDEKVDIAYDGIIEIEHGNHVFEVINMVSSKGKGSIEKNCISNKHIVVDETTKNIIIKVEI